MNAFTKHGINHLSASSINTFIAQPAAWCARYLMHKKLPVGTAAHRGTAVEVGIDVGVSNPDATLDQCVKIATERYDALVKAPVIGEDKERDGIPAMVEMGITALKDYGLPEKPAIGGGQQKIEIAVPELPVPVIGYLDFDYPQHGIIVDLKTTHRIPSQISPAHAIQGALYVHNSNIEMRFCYVSTKKVAVYRLDNIDQHYARFLQAAKALENFLSLSDDGEALTRSMVPNIESFYWNSEAARSVAQEIWG